MSLICDPANQRVRRNRVERICISSIPRELTDMRRKAEVLQYKKHTSNLTKKQRFAYFAKHPVGNNEKMSILSLINASKFNVGIYAPPVKILTCDTFSHSSRFILHTGDNGLVKSSYSASGVPCGSNSATLYYDSSIPLTNWKRQATFNGGQPRDKNTQYCITCCNTGSIKFSSNDAFNNALAIYFGETTTNTFGFTSEEIDQIGLFSNSDTKGNIVYWDVSRVTDMSNAFNAHIAVSGPNSGNITRAGFNENIGCWNVSRVINMLNFLLLQSEFNQNLKYWNVSSVTTTRNMFSGCSSFNQPLNDWDVSSVTDAYSMFDRCSLFNQPLNKWAFPVNTNKRKLFYSCLMFNQNLKKWLVPFTAGFDNTLEMFGLTPMAGTTDIDNQGNPLEDYFTQP